MMNGNLLFEEREEEALMRKGRNRCLFLEAVSTVREKVRYNKIR